MFISKNEDHKIWIGESPIYEEVLPPNLRIVFHSYKNPRIQEGISVILNGETHEVFPKEWEIQEFDVDSQKIESIKFIYNGLEIDFTKEYKKIMVNQIFYNHRP